MNKKPNSKTSLAVLEAVNKHGPISSPDLAVKMGKTVATIDFYMRILHAEPKQVYVANTRDSEGRGRNARLWAAGDLPDAWRPKAAPARVVAVAPTEADLEAQWAAEDLQMRCAALAENRVRRDPFIAQFFGASA
jgi:predicted ArsR family transcriptional regulator